MTPWRISNAPKARRKASDFRLLSANAFGSKSDSPTSFRASAKNDLMRRIWGWIPMVSAATACSKHVGQRKVVGSPSRSTVSPIASQKKHSVAPAGLEQLFFEVGVPVAQGATSASPPGRAEIEKLLAVAPRYGVEIRLPPY